MARTCTCDGVCSCVIVGGDGVVVEGSGTAADPYFVSTPAGSQITVQDTATVRLSLTPSGGGASTLRAETTVSMNELEDVSAVSPNGGDTLTWVTDHWEATPPSTVPPGAVSTGAGLNGDGSQADPLTVATSGTWGQPPLDIYGADDTVGQPVYVDSNGELRAEPKRDTAPNSERIAGYEVVVSETDPGNPATDRIWIQPV